MADLSAAPERRPSAGGWTIIDAVIVWMGSRFGPEDYLLWTRVQSLAWTAADVVIVYCLLRCANLARRRIGARPHRFAYVVLALTVFLAPGLATAASQRIIFALELLITVPHFLLILYLFAANAAVFRKFLDGLAHRRPSAQTGPIRT